MHLPFISRRVSAGIMRILLVAYEFPPSQSPQSLRWAYLSRELALAGMEMRVIAPRFRRDALGLPVCPECAVERTYPGPFIGILGALRGRMRDSSRDQGRETASATPGLNWKGKCIERMQSLLGACMFPDIRAEWNPWARRALRRQLNASTPDVMVTSHEPASVLILGMEARRAGVKWLADLGDPVHAPYTPSRWRGRALRLERQVCQLADHLTVTSTATRELLMMRHGVAGEKISVITQGFDSGEISEDASLIFPEHGDRLELLYTGSLYAFRRADALVAAAVRIPGVRLSIASRSTPDGLVALQRQHPHAIRLLGAQPHQRVLALQRKADVLVDLGNDQLTQVPGKFYEYLGAMRPILHVGPADSETAGHVQALHRGWTSENTPPALEQMLSKLVAQKRSDALEAGLNLDLTAVDSCSWASLSQRMIAIFQSLQAGISADTHGRSPVDNQLPWC